MAYLLKTPTVKEGPAGFGRLFYRYKIDRNDSLLIYGTSVVRLRTPSILEINEARYAYVGGHEYYLSQVEYDILTAAGYGAYITNV